jgi:hypothetical protein
MYREIMAVGMQRRQSALVVWVNYGGMMAVELDVDNGVTEKLEPRPDREIVISVLSFQWRRGKIWSI